MKRLRTLTMYLVLALPIACSNGGTGRQNASLESCFDTGHGVACESTPDGVETEPTDVDHDGHDDEFACADADSGSDTGDDSESSADDESETESASDTDADDDGVDDDLDCDHGGGSDDSASDDSGAPDDSTSPDSSGPG